MKKILITASVVALLVGLLPSQLPAQLLREYGDAPEGALAYPSSGTFGSFPTCLQVGPSGFVRHNNFGALFGPVFDFEIDGNAGTCFFPPYDLDECFFDGDAGLLLPQAYTITGPVGAEVVVPCPTGQAQPALGFTCQTAVWGANIDIDVTNFMPNFTDGFVNVLIDWNQDGLWAGSSPCPPAGIPAPEHVLVDFFIPWGFSGPLSALGPPSFLIGPNPDFVWARFSITNVPVGPGWDGSGDFEDGESEDYLLLVDPDDVPTIFPVIQTECPVIDTECPVIETECPVLLTECPTIATRCPEIQTECPVIETECSTGETSCSDIATECPTVVTHCPADPTFCPEVDTQCPADPQTTVCPVEATRCPVVETECPLEFTFCPEYETFCPEFFTFCPILPTECPQDPTFCPQGPTVCEFTICDVIPTWCPDEPTQCPVDLTLCPDIPTICPDIQTVCPEIITTCPATPTLCETPVPTVCPTDPTNCPVVSTTCPVNPTVCPTGPTFCSTVDTDGDGVDDCNDNCPNHPNGPSQGTCTATIGSNNIVSTGPPFCTVDGDCGPGEFCEKVQADTYPPGGNGIGDACDCEGNFDCDTDVDAADVTAFLADFGRSIFFNPCTNALPCDGDFLCDVDVDADDVAKFLEDFGRSVFFKPCPICIAGPWCSYP